MSYSNFIIFITSVELQYKLLLPFVMKLTSGLGGTINSFVSCVAAPVTSECFFLQAFRAVYEHSRGFI